MVDDATLGRALAASTGTGVLVCVHAEDGAAVERRVTDALAAGRKHPGWITEVRPPAVEADAIRRAATLAAGAGAPLYVVHVSSAAGLEAARRARQDDRAIIFAETCPQYLFLTSDLLRARDEEAVDFVCVPPLRSDEDRRALWEGLSEGSVDVVATDHCPFTRRARRLGVTGRNDGWQDFTEIPGGLPGVETRVSLLYQGVRQGWLSPQAWVAVVSGMPARLFGMAHCKGALAPGLDADVVVFDPAARKRLDAEALHMATDHSPYQGTDVVGWPAYTLARGRIVAKDGEPTDLEPGWGRFVPRRPFERG